MMTGSPISSARAGAGARLALLPLLAILLQPAGLCATFQFDSARTLPINTGAPLLSELNGDGLLDLAVTVAGGQVAILLGQGDGTFSETARYDAHVSGFARPAGDLDGDADVDLVVYRRSTDSVGVLRNEGDGTFSAFGDYGVGDEPRGGALADIDGDGDLDLGVLADGGVSVLLGSGDATFAGPTSWPSGEGPTCLAYGDMDNDGRLDLVVGNWQAEWEYDLWVYRGEVWIRLGNGDGTFGTEQVHEIDGIGIQDLDLGDLDGDGDLDVLLGRGLIDYYAMGGALTLWFGQGNGTLGARVTIDSGYYEQVRIHDLDADGSLDILAEKGVYNAAYEDGLQVFLGNGDGAFALDGAYLRGEAFWGFDLGDVDGDGWLDVALAMYYYNWSDDLAILRGGPGGSFRSAFAWETEEGTEALVSGDLNADGWPDLACALEGDPDLAVFLGDGAGSLGLPIYYGERGWVADLAAGDFDKDGHLDLAVAHDSSDASLDIYLGVGDGTFGDPFFQGWGYAPRALAAADLDRDGVLDLALCNSSEAIVLLGFGDGHFYESGTYTTGAEGDVVHVILGDLSGDGTPEMLLVSRGAGGAACSISVLPGRGDGSFDPAVSYPTGDDARRACLADLNGDLDLDVVVACAGPSPEYSGSLSVFLGRGDGTLEAVAAVPARDRTCWVSAGDVDRDGLPDLVAVNWDSHDATIHRGNGEGTFQEAQSYAAGPQPECATLADFDRDGDLDLAAGASWPLVSLLLNRAVPNEGDGAFIVTGPGRGADNPPLVRLFHPAAGDSPLFEWTAYGLQRYGVNVATGRLDAGGWFSVLAGPGPGPQFGPHVRGYRFDGVPIPGLSFLAYGTHRYGVNVACGDLDGDGLDEIVTGAGPGEVFGPHVRGWDWAAPSAVPIPGISFLAYGTHKFGVNVACGDLDGDGQDEIVTGAGPGAAFGPHVRGWDREGSGAAFPIPGISFFASGSYRWGVHVAAGDIDGDGFAEIVTGAGPGSSLAPHVRGWDWDGQGVARPIPEVNFIAYNSARWGVNVSCADLDGDGIDEILTGRGPGPDFPARVRGWDYDGQVIVAMPEVDFTAYDPASFGHGVKAAGGRRLPPASLPPATRPAKGR